MPKPLLELNFPTPDRLSVMTAATGRSRSASEVSQASIGDFYDAYYRQSVAQRASGVSQMHNGNSKSMDMGVGIAVTTGVKRSAPLNLKLGGSALACETIVEIPSPAPGPMFPFPHGEERYPAMI
jgi:hypothetical protein